MLHSLWYKGNSKENAICGKRLRRELFDVPWDWEGSCSLCKRSFPDQSGQPCNESKPSPVNGDIILEEDIELVAVVDDLGGAAWVEYAACVSWTSESAAGRPEELCPRCQAFCTFEQAYISQFRERLAYVHKGIKDGRTELEEVPPEKPHEGAADLVLTHRFRSVVAAVREFMEGSKDVVGLMFIVATVKLHGYMLCELLCQLHEVWFRSERHVASGSAKDMPVCGRPAAFVDGEVSEDLLEGVQEQRVRVVVSHSGAHLDSLPKGLHEACRAVIQWDWWCALPRCLEKLPVKRYVLKEMSPMGREVAAQCDADAGASAALGRQHHDQDAGLRSIPRAGGISAPPGLPLPTSFARMRPFEAPSAGPAAAAAAPPSANPYGGPVKKLPDSTQRGKELLDEALARGPSDSFSMATFLKRPHLTTHSPGQLQAPRGEVQDPERAIQSLKKPLQKTRCSNGDEMLLPLAADDSEQFSATGAAATPCITVKEEGAEGPWIASRPSADSSPRQFCQLCNAWADSVHLDSEAHKRARSHVVNEQVDRRQFCDFPSAFGDELELLRFATLHSIDLGQPKDATASPDRVVSPGWPSELLLIRLESAEQKEASCFAFLAAFPAGEGSPFFGYSLGFESAGLSPFTVKLKPEVLNWAAVWKSAKGRGQPEPEEVLKDFHEAMVLKLCPQCRPTAGQALLRRPTSALLVRVRPKELEGSDRDIFDFGYMKAEIENLVNIETASIVQHFTEEDDVSSTASTSSGVSTCGDTPEDLLWLVPLLHRFFHLRDFEAASLRYGPVFPPLTPLALEGALTLPNMGLVDAPFDKLRILGRKALGLLSVVALHCKDPSQHWKQLAQHAAKWMPREKLARLVHCAFPRRMLSVAVSKRAVNLWAPPGVRGPPPSATSFPAPTEEDLACIGEAFLGAYFTSEGGLLSCWLFLSWLQRKSENADLPADPISEIEVAVGHLLFGGCQPFRGRTPSYSAFYERHEKEANEHILVVTYTEQQQPVREYRRANCERRYPQEKIIPNEDKLGEWVPLVWSYKHRTFCTAGVEERFVPNKVLSWLMRRPAAPLVTVRAYTARGARPGRDAFDRYELVPPPEYAQLQEKKTGELRVLYKSTEVKTTADSGPVWFVYERSQSGDLGVEWKEDDGKESKRPLIYSERLKTLLSPALDKPLPNKITEAVHHHKNLVMIVTPKIGDLDELRRADECCPAELVTEQSNGDSNSPGTVSWTFMLAPRDGRSWRLRCLVETNDLGTVFMEFDEDTHKRQELIYSEELKTWLSPSLTEALKLDKIWSRGVPLPPKVLDKLKKSHQKLLHECIEMSDAFRKHYFQEPWRTVPYFIKALAPRSVQVGVIEGDILKYSFQNPMLLVEAMTHSTYKEAGTPSNERLATIGRHLVETLLVQEIARHSGLSMGSPSVFSDEFTKDHMSVPSTDTFVVAMRKDGVDNFRAATWPEASSQPPAETSHWLELVNACCNHVTYAYVCCEAKISCHILQSSPELRVAIEEFMGAVSALADVKSQTERWSVLIAKDAPRALSDVFLALAAAIFLDSDWISFCRVMLDKQSLIGKCLARLVKKLEEHPDLPAAEVSVLDPVAYLKSLASKERLAAHVQLLRLPSRSSDRQELETAEEALKAVRQSHDPSDPRDPHRGHTFNTMALLPLPSQIVSALPRYIQVAAGLRDFHCARLWIGGFAVGPFVLAASPRSAARRCASFALRGAEGKLQTEKVLCAIRSLLESDDKDGIPKRDELPKRLDKFLIGNVVRCSGAVVGTSVLDTKGSPAAMQEIGSGPQFAIDSSKMGADGSFYCDICDMWVNGQGQFDDHRNGKKHKKNLVKEGGRGARDKSGKDVDAPKSKASDVHRERDFEALKTELPPDRWPPSGTTNTVGDLAANADSGIGGAARSKFAQRGPASPLAPWPGGVAEVGWGGYDTHSMPSAHVYEEDWQASGYAFSPDQFAAYQWQAPNDMDGSSAAAGWQ